MRALQPVAAEPVVRFVAAVRAALDGSGPAVLPLAPAAGVPADLPSTVPIAVAAVVATSGSSGAPKRVALRAGALLASAAATEGALGGPGEWVLALPGHYVAGLQVVVRALAAGGEPHPVAPGHPPAEFAAAVEALPPNRRRYCSLVPTQLHRLLEAAEAGDARVAAALRSLDALLIGGGRLDAPLAARAAAAALRIHRTYGMTETAGGCVYDGVPLAGVEVRVRDGEVQLAGPVLAEGYLGDEARTAAGFLDEPGRRWYRTGDAGTWDGSRLAVTGRLDDVIVTGGEKVSLGLVERVVHDVPGLASAVVVSVPDAEWGEVPVVAADVPMDLAALRARVTAALGRAAAPRRALHLATVPLLPSGKPDRMRIRALARGEADPAGGTD